MGDITRIQFSKNFFDDYPGLPNGSRLVRKFLKTDKVGDLFGYVKAASPDIKEPFEVLESVMRSC